MGRIPQAEGKEAKPQLLRQIQIDEAQTSQESDHLKGGCQIEQGQQTSLNFILSK